MTESPFLPGTHKQFAWDSTSLGLMKECPRKYFYTLVQGWRGRSESVHLRFGILYHAALELYDRLRAEGVDHESAVIGAVERTLRDTWDNHERSPDGASILNTGAPWAPEHSSKTRFTLIRSIVWYLDEFRDDAAKTVILANGKPAVELSFKFNIGEGILLCGHLDRLVNFQDGVFVMDRKTTGSTITQHYFAQYSPHNQMSLYTLAGQIVYSAPVRGVIIDAAQIAVGFTRFQRGVTYRTTANLDEWLGDFQMWRDFAWRCADREHWPMNDKACSNFGGCLFQSVCSRDPSVRDKILQAEFKHDPWNPLESR